MGMAFVTGRHCPLPPLCTHFAPQERRFVWMVCLYQILFLLPHYLADVTLWERFLRVPTAFTWRGGLDRGVRLCSRFVYLPLPAFQARVVERHAATLPAAGAFLVRVGRTHTRTACGDGAAVERADVSGYYAPRDDYHYLYRSPLKFCFHLRLPVTFSLVRHHARLPSLHPA